MEVTYFAPNSLAWFIGCVGECFIGEYGQKKDNAGHL